MPHFLDAFVCFASMMQRYEIFVNYARKKAIIFRKNSKYSNIQIFKYDKKVFRWETRNGFQGVENAVLSINRIIIYYNI